MDFVLGKFHGVFIRVVQDAEALADSIGRGDVARGLRYPETERFGQMQSCVVLELGEAFRYEGQKVVDVAFGIVFSTLTLMGTSAEDAEVEGAWEWRKLGTEELYDWPYNSLCCQRSSPIPET